MYTEKVMFGINKSKNKIDELLKEVRAEYDDLITNFGRPRSLAREFDFRYHDAVEYRLDLMHFLQAEKEAAAELRKQSEALKAADKEKKAKTTRANKPPVREPVPVGGEKGGERISFADKLIQEFTDRIQKYPEIIIHPDAAFEMKKLFGALSCIENDYWSIVDRIVRGQTGSKRFRDTIDLEPEIARMCTPGMNGVPNALGTYRQLLERMPRDYKAVEREEKRCLVNAASLLKKIQMEIITALDTGTSIEQEERDKMVEAKVYIDSMIEDFRLKDLGRLK